MPRSMPTTSTPVAMGSNVPECPTRRVPMMRRSLPTTSWLVIPAGLSTITTPERSKMLPLNPGEELEVRGDVEGWD